MELAEPVVARAAHPDVGGEIVGSIVAEGVYTLLSPAHFGGDEGEDTAMALLRHADGSCFIPGATIAGAGRAALNARILGWSQYRQANLQEPPEVEQLFGGGREGNQSALIVDDAELEPGVAPLPYVRDGVAIEPKRGTARQQHKYDMEVLPTGTRFRLRFELLRRRGHDEQTLTTAFGALLEEFQNEDWPIHLGARTRRGYGAGRVDRWDVRAVDFNRPADVSWWLLSDRRPGEGAAWSPDRRLDDQRRWCRVRATLEIQSSLLIRTYPTDVVEPDAVPVRSRQRGGLPVVPGTSVAGACRQRALKIARSLAEKNEVRAAVLVRRLFGPDPEELKVQQHRKRGAWREPLDSRILLSEARIEGGVEEVQSRIQLDPFTGGTREGALFDEQAVWSGPTAATLTLEMLIRDPDQHEMGLLLQLLKDLWTEDLPLGGGAAIGRGVLRGREATFVFHTPEVDEGLTFQIDRADAGPRVAGLTSATARVVNQYAEALVRHLQG
jgi:CRISPR/Cas system CSM-associated protein Csm3 (group 7 of RAMP superfamily)